MRTIRIAVLGGLLSFGSASFAGDDAADEFGVKEARALIPKAAAGQESELRIFRALGASLRSRDIHEAGSVPLTHALLLIPAFHAPQALARDFRTLAPFFLTPVDLCDVFYGAPIGAAKADRRFDVPSALRDEYLTDVSCVRAGDAAHGEVRFKAPGAYEGRAEWTASRAGGRWRIDSFALPSWGLHIRLVGDAWKATRAIDVAKPWMLSASQVAVPSSDLMRAGAIWDAPADPLEIAIAADGTIWLVGVELGLERLQQALRGLTRDPRMRNPDGTSRIEVVLRIAPTAPWTLVQWVMQTCVDRNIQIHRVYFAAMAEAGGEEGVIPVFLPRDRGFRRGDVIVEDVPHVRAMLFAAEGTVDRGAIFAQLKSSLDATTDKTVNIETPPPRVPRAGHVISVVDLAYRAGARWILFNGTALPKSREAQGGNSATTELDPTVEGSLAWLRAWVVTANRERPAGLKVRFGKTLIEGAPGAAPIPLPTPPPRRAVPPQIEIAAPTGELEEPSLDETPPEPDEPPPEPDGTEKVPVSGGRPPVAEPELPPMPANSVRGAFRARFARRTDELRPVVDVTADEAIDRALAWLAAHQSPDGGWESANFGAWCNGRPAESGTTDGAGKTQYDVGVSALALLSFLGAGYTNRSEGPYGKVLGNGLKYLRNVQDAEGCFGNRSTGHYVYNHAIATLAMVEAFGMTGSSIYKAPCQKALDFVGLARNPYFAWRYGIKPGDNDTSVTYWMTLALSAAKMVNAADVKDGRSASLVIDEDAFAGVRAWLDKMTDPDTGRVGYQQRGTGPARTQALVDRFPAARSESQTAIGVLLRVLLGEDAASSKIQSGAALLSALPPVWNATDGSIDLYYWHAGALASHQLGGATGGAWSAAIPRALVEHQRLAGDACGLLGSWDPIDPWGADGGRIYATAMATLALLAPESLPRMVSGKQR